MKLLSYALIFDCDGVLVDSEALSNRALAETICGLGWQVSETECLQRFRGVAQPEIWRIVEQQVGALPRTLEAEYRRRQYGIFRSAPCRAVPGVHDVIESLVSKGVPFCVASNGPPEKMVVTLGVADLLHHFPGRIFSRVDVVRPKPAPDLFLHAAGVLGVRPTETWVVEDSPTGLVAAKAAGMPSIGFTGTGASAHDLLEAGATLVAGSMPELSQLLCG